MGVPEIEKYFNAIRTMKARFVQTNPNGSIIQGTLYVRRPGRMRFEYSAVAAQDRGRRLPGDDVGSDDEDFGQWPIGWTAASFLVKEPFSLSGDLRVEKLERVNGLIEATMAGTEEAEGWQGDRPLCGKPADAARLDDHR